MNSGLRESGNAYFLIFVYKQQSGRVGSSRATATGQSASDVARARFLFVKGSQMSTKRTSFLALIVFTTLFGCTRSCDVDVDGYDFTTRECDLFRGLEVIPTNGEPVSDKTCNKVYRKKDFAEEPRVIYSAAENNKYYTIFILDPDAPNTPKGFFYLHLIRANIPGSLLRDVKSTKHHGGNVVTSYAPPTPPRGTGKHRYLVALYEQAHSKETFTAPATRAKFALVDWLRFKNLCGPIAGTQFRAYYEF